MRIAAVIVAAGRGTRAGGGLAKQWRPLGGERVIDRTLGVFLRHPKIDEVCVVTAPEDRQRLDGLPVTWAAGGETRAGSVLSGLTALDPAPTLVLIHDAARPCVSPQVIDRVLKALQTHSGAAPGLAVTDALWRAEGGLVDGTADRAGLYRAQTPQGFHFDLIRAAHQTDAAQDAADDVTLARAAGHDVAIVAGDPDNIKITQPGDFARAEQILAKGQAPMRIGSGFDVHRFGAGDHVVLCGVTVPFGRGLQGHSDADVGLHALTDAIYGALAEGDIGRHFPPSDPQWKGADSAVFLRHAVERVAARGFEIANADLTLMCEAPKIGPHAAAMCARVAELCGVDVGQISVKATTTERLGFTGRGEGIAAQATVLLTGTGSGSGGGFGPDA